MTIEDRIDRLERRVNRYRLATALMVVLFCAVALTGAGRKVIECDILRAKEIKVVDDEGNNAISMGIIEHRSPSDSTKVSHVTSGIWLSQPGHSPPLLRLLATRDGSQIVMEGGISDSLRTTSTAVFLSGDSWGGSLRIYDGKGGTVVNALDEGGEGHGRCQIGGSEFAPLVTIGSTIERKYPSLWSAADYAPVFIGTDAEQRGLVTLRGTESTTSVVMHAGEPGGMGMFLNTDGNPIAHIGAGKHGSGSLILSSKEGWVGSVLDSDDNGGRAMFANKTGEDVVHIYADDYGHGYIGVWDRKGKGRTLTPR